MEWIALRHALLVHLPVATGFLLPLALLASLRPGRGIRPWWTACRYIAWAGFVGLLASLLSGWLWARSHGLLPPGSLLPARGIAASAHLYAHSLWALAGLPVALATLWAMHRDRKDHQGFGFLPLLFGIAWAALSLQAGRTGHDMNPPAPRVAQPAAKPMPSEAPLPPRDLEPQAPLRALDFAGLEPLHTEPVKSPPHGGRWIRVWATAGAAEAYRSGHPLPSGSLVVMSTLEDRWGRPSVDSGPLYAVEMKDGKPLLTFYWPRVPEARRTETGGEGRAYWRSPHPRLEACLTCHRDGPAEIGMRSRWRAAKKPKVETTEPAPE